MSRKKRETPLTSVIIIDHAFTLIDAEGLENFSIRRLAGTLQVEPMSIYHHFPAKLDILDAVAERLLQSMVFSEPESGTWLQRFRLQMYAYVDLARQHPRVFPLLTQRRFNRTGQFEVLEKLLATIREGGFDAATTTLIFRTTGAFLNGSALTYITVQGLGSDAPMTVHLDQAFRDGRFPTVVQSAPFLGKEHFDATFDFGVRLLIERFAAMAAIPQGVV